MSKCHNLVIQDLIGNVRGFICLRSLYYVRINELKKKGGFKSLAKNIFQLIQ